MQVERIPKAFHVQLSLFHHITNQTNFYECCKKYQISSWGGQRETFIVMVYPFPDSRGLDVYYNQGPLCTKSFKSIQTRLSDHFYDIA